MPITVPPYCNAISPHLPATVRALGRTVARAAPTFTNLKRASRPGLLAVLLMSLTLPSCATAAEGIDDACNDAPRIVAALRAAWSRSDVAVTTAMRHEAVPPIKTAVRHALRLHDEAGVQLRAPGRRSAGHAGIVRTTVAASGLYRVMSSQRAWIEVLPPEGPALPVFMRPLRCLRGEGVQKELVYRLEAGVDYRLELSAAALPELSLMVVAEPAP